MMRSASSIDRGGLRQERHLGILRQCQGFGFLFVLDENDMVRSLPHGADHFVVAFVADEDNRVSLLGEAGVASE